MRSDLARDQRWLARLIELRASLDQVEHANIVTILDLVVGEGTVTVVSPLIDGTDLDRMLGRVEKLPAPRAARLIGEVLSALAAAHEAGLVHGGMRAENVLVTGNGRVRVTDFGIAALAGRSSATSALDVYSAGALFHELLTGAAPTFGTDTVLVQQAGLPDKLWELLAAMLALDPDLRPAAGEARLRLAALGPRLTLLDHAPAAEAEPSTEIVEASPVIESDAATEVVVEAEPEPEPEAVEATPVAAVEPVAEPVSVTEPEAEVESAVEAVVEAMVEEWVTSSTKDEPALETEDDAASAPELLAAAVAAEPSRPWWSGPIARVRAIRVRRPNVHLPALRRPAVRRPAVTWPTVPSLDALHRWDGALGVKLSNAIAARWGRLTWPAAGVNAMKRAAIRAGALLAPASVRSRLGRLRVPDLDRWDGTAVPFVRKLARGRTVHLTVPRISVKGQPARLIAMLRRLPASSSSSAGTAPLPLKPMPAQKTKFGWPREQRLATTALIAVCALVVAGVAAAVVKLVWTSTPSASSTYAFSPESYDGGLVIGRSWTLAGDDGSHLQATVVASNGLSTTIKGSYDEVIPKSVAGSDSAISFTPQPTDIVRTDPVVRYAYRLEPGTTMTISYGVDIGRTHGSLRTRLADLALDQSAAQTEYLDSIGSTPPATLTSVTIGPQDLDLAVGQTSTANITGVMSNGSFAQQAELNAVQWTSDNDAVATVDHTSITAVGAGGASVTAQSGALSASIKVNVVAPQSGVAAVATSNTSKVRATTAAPRSTARAVAAPVNPGVPTIVVANPTVRSSAPAPTPSATPTPPGLPGAPSMVFTGSSANSYAVEFTPKPPVSSGTSPLKSYTVTYTFSGLLAGSGGSTRTLQAGQALDVSCAASDQVTTFSYFATSNDGSGASAGPFTSNACSQMPPPAPPSTDTSTVTPPPTPSPPDTSISTPTLPTNPTSS